MPGETTDTGMSSFTASALLAPPIGASPPTAASASACSARTSATRVRHGHGCTALDRRGKVKLGGLIVLKGEYRRLDLSGHAAARHGQPRLRRRRDRLLAGRAAALPIIG